MTAATCILSRYLLLSDFGTVPFLGSHASWYMETAVKSHLNLL